ncbi:conserved membrane protein of unknown function [Tenacibaculum sp. 190130A14a]|uniref:Uncharacterized protein n=1 Tax=Tenacibaculum polynesiense TaxID=3137857 RepID=A0ABM9PBJ4_9FLAO
MQSKTKKFVRFLIPISIVVLPRLLRDFFGFDINVYIDKIPSYYFTIALILLLVYSIVDTYKKFYQEVKTTNNILFIASENDYYRKNTAHGFLTVLTIGFCFYAMMPKVHSINNSLFIVLLYLAGFRKSILNKTAMFELKNDTFLYTNEKEKQTFNTENLQSIIIANNSISLQYTSSEKLISFLEINEEDFKEIKSWFLKHLPNITITKSN